nr:MAG TPA: hypothetical protein [Caudoviricetes sp.]
MPCSFSFCSRGVMRSHFLPYAQSLAPLLLKKWRGRLLIIPCA